MIRHFTASAVVLDTTNNVLLVEHKKSGLWLYPGGHLEPDESLAEAAVREVAEETGIQATIITTPAFTHPAVTSHPTPWAVIEMEVTDSTNGQHRHIDAVYVCRPVGGTLTAQIDEVDHAAWIPLDRLPDLHTPKELPDLVTAAAQWTHSQD